MSQSLASWSQRKIRLSKETPSVKVCGLRRCPICEAWRGRKSEAHLIADNSELTRTLVYSPAMLMPGVWNGLQSAIWQ